MPGPLKIRAPDTDARAMSDTAVTSATETTPTLPGDTPAPAAPDGFFLDGDAPRLASAPILPPAPMGAPGPTDQTDQTDQAAGSVPSEPEPTTTTAPEPSDDASRVAHQLVGVDPADLPSLPTASPVSVSEIDDETTAEAVEPADHPMAHLMPAKSKPTEASMRAAAIRAEKQAKAKKIKIGVAIGAIVVTAVVGPPLWSWLSNAVNEAGGSTEQTD